MKDAWGQEKDYEKIKKEVYEKLVSDCGSSIYALELYEKILLACGEECAHFAAGISTCLKKDKNRKKVIDFIDANNMTISKKYDKNYGDIMLFVIEEKLAPGLQVDEETIARLREE